MQIMYQTISFFFLLGLHFFFGFADTKTCFETCLPNKPLFLLVHVVSSDLGIHFEVF